MERNLSKETFLEKSHLIKVIFKFIDVISESVFRRLGISQRLLITFIILTIIPLCIVGFTSINSSTMAMEENISNYSIQILSQVKNNLTNELNRLEALSTEISISPEMKVFDDSLAGKSSSSCIDALRKLEGVFISKVSGSNDIASIAFYPRDFGLVAKTDVLINSCK